MNRITWWSWGVVSLLCAVPLERVAWAAHNDPQVEAACLQHAVCDLRTELEFHGAGSYAVRSAARLETAVIELAEKLSCPHDWGAVEFALHESHVWLERTSVGIEAVCCLRDSHRVAHALELVSAKLASTHEAVDCWLLTVRPSHHTHVPPAPPLPLGTHFGFERGHVSQYGSHGTQGTHTREPWNECASAATARRCSAGSVPPDWNAYRSASRLERTMPGLPVSPTWRSEPPRGQVGQGEIGPAIVGKLIREIGRR